ncbi:toll/interleukin-1 receptor domain-containing adapter protein isoform 3-T7 [Cyanocitta cristata]
MWEGGPWEDLASPPCSPGPFTLPVLSHFLSEAGAAGSWGHLGVFRELYLGKQVIPEDLSLPNPGADASRSLLRCQTPAFQERCPGGNWWLSSVLPTMAGWFRRLLHKPKPSSVESLKSSHSTSSSPSSSSSSSSAKSSSSSSMSLATSSISLSPVSAPDISTSDSPRWDKSYDVCICHTAGCGGGQRDGDRAV